MTSAALAIVLPPREGFSPKSYGAVSLCVRDFVLHSRLRDQTIVIGTDQGDAFAGIRYISVTPNRKWFETHTKAYAREILKAASDHGVEMLEVHNRPALLRTLAKHTNIKLALHLHNDPQEMRYAATPSYRREVSGCCSVIYCVSEYIRRRWEDGWEDEKCHVVYNGLEIPPLPAAKEELILYVGRMTPNKGAKIFAKALAKALPKLQGWQGVLVGGRRHQSSKKLSPYEKKVLYTLAHVNAARVEGFQTHDAVMALMARASIVVVPSLWEEPFGRTALEAMASGCAVISSGRGGLKEVGGDVNHYVDPMQPAALAEALIHLATNAQERQQLQRGGYARSQEFSIQSQSKLLDDIRSRYLYGV